MSFTVNLYRFSKKENSTARPGSEPASFPCRLREPSGILNPSIMLDLGLLEDPSGYNYAYIPEYGRYYWINEWTFERACWIASMSVDVLATWKDYIGSESLYVLRSSAAYNGSVSDRHYPGTGELQTVKIQGESPWSFPLIDDGTYIIGVVSKDASHGSIQYWAATSTQMRDITAALMSDIVTSNNFDPADASLALQKALIDPFQYIKSCIWIPFTVGQLPASLGPFTIFDFQLANTQAYAYTQSATGVIQHTYQFSNIPRHPQAASRGMYMNCAPFTEAELIFPPFGVIPLDARMLANADHLITRIFFDTLSGHATLEVQLGSTVVNRITAQVGVPIQLAQIRNDVIGAMSGLTQAAGAAFTGNVMGAAAGIGSMLEGLIPRASTMGSAGSWGDLVGAPDLNLYFTMAVDEDIQHHGRPLCQNRVISSIPGYILVQDGDISIPGTIDENTSVKTYLEGGFFYE